MFFNQWLIIAIETDIAWPTEDTYVDFKDYKFLLRPESEDNFPTVCFKFGHPENKLTREEALLLTRNFLSALSWSENKSVREVTTTGGGHLFQIGKPGKFLVINKNFKADHLPEVNDPQKKLALALYREALSVNSIPYQFLGHFKIINILFERGPAQKTWIGKTIPNIANTKALKRINELNNEKVDIPDYLNESGRCAVAHAFSDPLVNPENPDDLERLRNDLPVIQALSEYLIEFELNISSKKTIINHHHYELDGFRKILGEENVEAIKENSSLKTENGLEYPKLGIRIRDQDKCEVFENLNVVDQNIIDGVLILKCNSKEYPITAHLILNFTEERLVFEPFKCVNVIEKSTNDETVLLKIEKDIILFTKNMVGNGQIEVWDSENDVLLGRTDPYIPVNIDFDKTYENFDIRLSEIDEKLSQTK